MCVCDMCINLGRMCDMCINLGRMHPQGGQKKHAHSPPVSTSASDHICFVQLLSLQRPGGPEKSRAGNRAVAVVRLKARVIIREADEERYDVCMIHI